MTTNPELQLPHLVTRILHLPMTSDADAFGMTAQVTERIVIALESPGRECWAKLADFVISSIEADLIARGAAPAGFGADASFEAQIDDQLYRARLLGAGGLALRFSGLEALAGESGQLGEADSETLRRLLRIAEHERLQLYLPLPTAALRVVGAPHQLSDWLSSASRAGRVASIEYEPATPATDADSATRGQSELRTLSEPALEAFVQASPLNAVEECNDDAADSVPAEREGVEATSDLDLTPTAPRVEVSPSHDPTAAIEQSTPQPSNVVPTPEPLDPERVQRCATWAGQLRNMNGPKTHASVERAFLTSYLPLSREAAAGRATPEAISALEVWAEGFAQSYAAAFKTLGLRGKRPRMVRDVIELGIAWLNQLRARQCQLLLIDGMRFDLGQRLNEQLERRLAGRAICPEQTLLWAALPSNAESQQLGVSGASRRANLERRRPAPTDDPTPRIEGLRVGPRELFRLEQVGVDLAQPGECEAERLERLAASLADTVAPWMQAQPADTLVVVFGDHGFHWQAAANGTSPARRGGALPEQVLVPASGWLLGQVAARPRIAVGLH